MQLEKRCQAETARAVHELERLITGAGSGVDVDKVPGVISNNFHQPGRNCVPGVSVLLLQIISGSVISRESSQNAQQRETPAGGN